jgi:hypothetical protein
LCTKNSPAYCFLCAARDGMETRQAAFISSEAGRIRAAMMLFLTLISTPLICGQNWLVCNSLA